MLADLFPILGRAKFEKAKMCVELIPFPEFVFPASNIFKQTYQTSKSKLIYLFDFMEQTLAKFFFFFFIGSLSLKKRGVFEIIYRDNTSTIIYNIRYI